MFINKIFIYLIVYFQLKERVVPSMQEYIAIYLWDDGKYFKSTFCLLECGDIFFACQTTRGMEMSKCRGTNIFIFLEGEKCSLWMNTRKKPITLFQSNNDRTDLIPYTSFFNTACCMQLPSWSINPKCIRAYSISILGRLTPYYLYFPHPKIDEMLKLVRVWYGSGVTQEGHAIFWTYGWFGIKLSIRTTSTYCLELSI